MENDFNTIACIKTDGFTYDESAMLEESNNKWHDPLGTWVNLPALVISPTAPVSNPL